MKKRSLLFLCLCIGLFIPTSVFARRFYYKSIIDIDYMIVDEQNRTDLKYIIHDNSGAINLESEYDYNTNSYMLKQSINENSRNSLFVNMIPDVIDKFDTFEGKSWSSPESCESDYKNIINSSSIMTFSDFKFYSFFPYENDDYHYSLSSNGIVPLVLEQYQSNTLLSKKIIFGSIHNGIFVYSNYSISETLSFSLLNNNENYPYDGCHYDFMYGCYGITDYSDSNNNPDNIEFMTNTIYDYSDELWNEVNNTKISSSEIDEQVADILSRTNSDKVIYSKYKSNVNYRFKVKNGNGMNFKLHDISNTFNFSSLYDKDSDTYSIIDNSSDSDYQDGIKEFSKIIIDEVKNGNFSGLSSKYKSITSDSCSESSCNIYTYIPMILEGESNTGYAKQIVLGLMNIQYRGESGKDYYDIGLSVYNNTCDLLNSNIDANQSELINLSRAIEKDYSSNLMNQYSDGSISMEDIYEDVDVNTLKDKYCNELPVISLRQNPKTLNNGIVVLIISMLIVIGSSVLIIKKRSVKV